MAKMTAEGFAKKYLQAEAKGDRGLTKVRPELERLAADMIAVYGQGPSLNARDRKTFVKSFLTGEAKGSVLLTLLLPLLIPIFQKLLEAFLQKEAA